MSQSGQQEEFWVDVVLEDAIGRPMFRFNGERLRTMTVGHFKEMLKRNLQIQLEEAQRNSQNEAESSEGRQPGMTLKLLGAQRMRSDYETIGESVRPFGVPLGGESRSVSTTSSQYAEEHLLRVYSSDPFLTVDLLDVSDFSQFQLHKLLPHTTIAEVRNLFGHHRQSILINDLRALRTGLGGSDPNNAGRGVSSLSEGATLSSLRTSDDGGVIRIQTVAPTLVEARIDPRTYSAAYVREQQEETKKKKREAEQKEGQQQHADDNKKGSYSDPNAQVEGWDEEGVAVVKQYKKLLQDMRENWKANDRFAFQLLETRYDLEDELKSQTARLDTLSGGKTAQPQHSSLSYFNEVESSGRPFPSLTSVQEELRFAQQRTQALVLEEKIRREATQRERDLEQGVRSGPVLVYGGGSVAENSPYINDTSAVSPVQRQNNTASVLTPSRNRGNPVLVYQSPARAGGGQSPALEVSAIGGTPRSATREPRGFTSTGLDTSYQHEVMVANYPPLFTPRPAVASTNSGTTSSSGARISQPASSRNLPLVVDLKR